MILLGYNYKPYHIISNIFKSSLFPYPNIWALSLQIIQRRPNHNTQKPPPRLSAYFPFFPRPVSVVSCSARIVTTFHIPDASVITRAEQVCTKMTSWGELWSWWLWWSWWSPARRAPPPSGTACWCWTPGAGRSPWVAPRPRTNPARTMPSLTAKYGGYC